MPKVTALDENTTHDRTTWLYTVVSGVSKKMALSNVYTEQRVYADATSRDADITSPAEGETAILTDSDSLTAYIDSEWVVLPRSLSVVPTGGDDLAAIQAAIDAAAEDRTVVLAGDFSVSGELTITTDGIKLLSQGATITQTLEDQVTIAITGDRVTIDGIHFIGKGTEDPWAGDTSWKGVAGVYINACDSTCVQNCRFTNHAGGSIAMTGVCNDTVIDKNYIAGMGSPTISDGDNGGDGAINTVGNSQAKNGLRITNNYIKDHAFGMFGAAGSWVVSHNVIDGIPGQHGMYFLGVCHLVLSDNIVLDTADDGIKAMQLAQSADSDVVATVSDNTIVNSGQFGLVVNTSASVPTYYMNNVLIANNNIYDSTAAGLYVQGARHCHISGNRIYKAGTYGIWIRYSEATLINNRVEQSEILAVYIYRNNGVGPCTIDGLTVIDCPLNTSATNTWPYRSVIGVDNDSVVAGTEAYIGNVHHRFLGANYADYLEPDTTYPPQYLINAYQNSDVVLTGPVTSDDLTLVHNFAGVVTDRTTDAIDVSLYGATGDGTTNDATAIQAAIDAYTDGTHKEIYFPPGTYICNATIDVDGDAANATIRADRVTLDFDNATISNSTCLRFYGGAQTSIDDASGQTGDEAVGNSTWNIVGHGVVVGDVVVAENTTNASYSGYSNDYHKKERFVVREIVDANNFVTEQKARFAWTAAEVTWTKMPGASPTIEGDLTVIGKGRVTDGDYAITYENCSYPKVGRGVTARAADIACFQFKECYGVALDGLHVLKELDSGHANCQAVLIESCQNVRITNCELYGDYNAIKTGGVGLNMDVHVAHCTLNSYSRHAVHCLGNLVYSSFKHCEIDAGVLLGGNHNEISHCKVAVESTSAQDAITLEECSGLDMRFVNNHFTGLGASKYAIFASNIPVNCTEGGTCIVRDCLCDTPAAADAGIMFYFRTDGTGPTAAISYNFSGIRCSNLGTASGFSIYVYHSNGTFPSLVSVDNCRLPGGLFIPNVTGRALVNDVSIANASGGAISITQVSQSIDVSDVTIEALETLANTALLLTGKTGAANDRITVRDVTVMGTHNDTLEVQLTDLALIDGLYTPTQATSESIKTVNTVAEMRCYNTHITDLDLVNLTGLKHMWNITAGESPAAKLAGSPGSIVMNTAGGTSTTMYVKETGSDMTSGWVACVLT